MVFAQRKQDVDAIHEYLLLKGVEAVAVHGGKGRISFYLKHATLQKDWDKRNEIGDIVI